MSRAAALAELHFALGLNQWTDERATKWFDRWFEEAHAPFHLDRAAEVALARRGFNSWDEYAKRATQQLMGDVAKQCVRLRELPHATADARLGCASMIFMRKEPGP